MPLAFCHYCGCGTDPYERVYVRAAGRGPLWFCDLTCLDLSIDVEGDGFAQGVHDA